MTPRLNGHELARFRLRLTLARLISDESKPDPNMVSGVPLSREPTRRVRSGSSGLADLLAALVQSILVLE